MANVRNVYQQQNTVSIPRNAIMDITLDSDLSGKDIKVMLVLLTQLDGYSTPESGNGRDPVNFKKLDFNAIADILDISKKSVKKSVSWLTDLGYLEIGCSDTVKDGYRFTF